MSSRTRLVVSIVAAIAAVYVFGYWIAQQNVPSDVRLYTEAIYIGIAATGLNILTGYNGQVSIGHGAFFGLGAYTTAILVADHGWNVVPTIPVSMALCFVVGALIGFPALRVKGLYLALVTLGLAVVFPDLTDRFVNGTGGTNLVTLQRRGRRGSRLVRLVPRPDREVPRQVGGRARPVGVLPHARHRVAAARSRCSSWRGAGSGARSIAVRDHEAAAETVGINLAQVKVTAFALSALYAGTAGSLSVLVTRLANAGKVETFQLSIEFLVAVVIGGAATVIGPMLGGFIVVLLRDRIDNTNRLSDLFSDPNRAKLLSPAIFGIALIILMYVLPDGIVGGARRGIRRLTRRQPPPPTPLAS